MAEKKVIAATLQVDTGSSNANIQEVNKNLTDVRGSLAATGATAGKTGKDVEGAGGSFGKLKSQIGTLPGPLGQAQESVGKLSMAFKALLANPVGLIILAIVAALALLYKAFTNTFEGGQKMEQVFAGIKAAAQALIDNITKMAGAIVKLFKFDFSGAIADIKGVAREAGAAFQAMAKLTKEAQILDKEQAQNDVEQAQRATRLAKLREDAYDDSVPIAERRKLLTELKDEQEKDAIADIERAKKRAANTIGQLTIEKEGANKNYKEIAAATIALEAVKTDAANEGRRIAKSISTAEKEEAAERKSLHDAEVTRIKSLTDAQKEAEKERLAIIERDVQSARKQRDEDLKNAADQRKDQEEKNEMDAFLESTKVTIRETNNAALIAATQLTSDQIVKITEDEAARKKLIADIESDYRQYVIHQIAEGLGTISQIVGKQTAVGKAFAIAETTINTYQAGFAAFKGMVTSIPGPVGIALGVVAAAGALASGIAAVKKIVAVKLPGGGSGGAVPSTLGLPAAPIAPQAASTKIDQTQFNQISGVNSPARAYVLSQDIQADSNRYTRLERAAKLG